MATIRESIDVSVTPATVVHLWTNPASLVQFVSGVESVTEQGDGVLAWQVKRNETGMLIQTRLRMASETAGLAFSSFEGPAWDVTVGVSSQLTAGASVTVEVDVDPEAAFDSWPPLFDDEVLREDLSRFKALAERGPAGMDIDETPPVAESGPEAPDVHGQSNGAFEASRDATTGDVEHEPQWPAGAPANASRPALEAAIVEAWQAVRGEDIESSRGDITALADIIRARTGEPKESVERRLAGMAADGSAVATEPAGTR